MLEKWAHQVQWECQDPLVILERGVDQEMMVPVVCKVWVVLRVCQDSQEFQECQDRRELEDSVDLQENPAPWDLRETRATVEMSDLWDPPVKWAPVDSLALVVDQDLLVLLVCQEERDLMAPREMWDLWEPLVPLVRLDLLVKWDPQAPLDPLDLSV